MKAMKPGLFVYGTLHPDRAPHEIREAVHRLTPVASGTVTGAVYDLGEYPALLPNRRKGKVKGTIFALPEDDPSLLKALDTYEEFFSERTAASLFVRQKRTVTLENGRRERHWVYVYNQPIPTDLANTQRVA